MYAAGESARNKQKPPLMIGIFCEVMILVESHRENSFITDSFRNLRRATYSYVQNQELTISTCSSQTDFDSKLMLQGAGLNSVQESIDDGTSEFYT